MESVRRRVVDYLQSESDGREWWAESIILFDNLWGCQSEGTASQALAEWARGQPFRGIVRLGKIESGDSRLRRITEWVFEVDNLSGTDAERTEVAARQAQFQRQLEAMLQTHAEPGAAADGGA